MDTEKTKFLISSYASLLFFMFFLPPGDHSSVRAKPAPHSVQELPADVCSEGQPRGELHDHDDRHHCS